MSLGQLQAAMAIGELPAGQLVDRIFENDDIRRIYFLSPVAYETISSSSVRFEPDALLIDAVSMVSLLNWCWRTRLRRYSFDNRSIAPLVFQKVAEKGMRLAIIGASEDENRIYCERLRKQYPNINLVISQHGFLSELEKEKLIEHLNAVHPDVVVVGMGSPAQEIFGNRVEINPGQKLFTCGAHITQSSGNWDYYPDVINKLNLRWLYRLVVEPHTRRRVPKILSGLFHAWRATNG